MIELSQYIVPDEKLDEIDAYFYAAKLLSKEEHKKWKLLFRYMKASNKSWRLHPLVCTWKDLAYSIGLGILQKEGLCVEIQAELIIANISRPYVPRLHPDPSPKGDCA